MRRDEADGQMGGLRVQAKEFRASVSPGADVLPFITSVTQVSPWDLGMMDQKGLSDNLGKLSAVSKHSCHCLTQSFTKAF